MALALNEDDAGINREIWYPNLHSCLGLTMVLDNGKLLGTHLTTATKYSHLGYIFEYLEGLRGGAQILSMLLVGNLGSWNTKEQSMLRSGGNLRETLWRRMNVNCKIYEYDSMRAAGGGNGAAAHLIHQGGAFPFPHVEIFQSGAWTVGMALSPNEPVVNNLEIKHAFVPSVELMELGERHGMFPPSTISVINADGEKTTLAESDMDQR